MTQMDRGERQPCTVAFMRASRLLLHLLLMFGFVTTLPTLPAQSSFPGVPSNQPTWYLGYNGFRMLLEERGLTASTDLSRTLSTPSESVVVMFGDLSEISRTEWLRLRRFVSQGGSLLVASERAFQLPGVTTFSLGSATTTRAADQYEGYADCIALSDLNTNHPLGKGLRHIIVNKTGWLSRSLDTSLDWQVIASLPDDCSPQAAQGQPVLLTGLDPIEGRGVMILSADQSLFSDGMLWHGDNSLLAIQACDLLCRGQRKWLTVYENGSTLPSYLQAAAPPSVVPPVPPVTPPVPPNVDPPEPELATMLKIANKVIDEVQESNILNETLKDRPRNVRPVAWLRTMLLIALILFTLFILWRMSQTRWNLIPNRHSRFLQSMYGVHSANQLQASEFGAAAEVLSRNLCRELTGSDVETVWQKVLSDAKHPNVASLPRSLRKGLMELVSIATRGCRIHISRRKFQSMGRTIQAIRLLHRSKRAATA